MAHRISMISRIIEVQTDDDGRVKHVKCSNCCWTRSVSGDYDADSTIREMFNSFSDHDCENHRIGFRG
jgi:hypothetical protein